VIDEYIEVSERRGLGGQKSVDLLRELIDRHSN